MVEVSDDRSRIDVDLVSQWLHDSYWAAERPREVIEKSIANSHCFAAFIDGKQVGFTRVVTDHATFAWVCDVIVDPGARGQGVGKALMQAVVEHPDYREIRQVVLATKDAHGLYEQFGFSLIPHGRWMARRSAAYQIN
ncbi:MAG: GNAT family N-acetyltransferase [Fimbriimonadaceae bacterium]|nr:GNAT family N-acetyltransferase [Fimbriimonadaceae bacterium]